MNKFNCVLILLLIGLEILLWGCADRATDGRLARAEALMMHAPDSALAVLDSVNAASLRGRQAALHALLLTHARYRNYLVDTDDSLARLAVDYFTRHDDPRRLMTALYCLGRVHDNAGRSPEAMTAALHTLDLAERLDDHFYKARAHELMGDLWYAADSYELASEHFRLAATFFDKADKSDSHRWSLGSMAMCMMNAGRYPRAVEILDSLNKEFPDDSVFVYYNTDNLVTGCILAKDYGRAFKFQNTLISNGFGDTAANHFRLSQIHSLQGAKDKAEEEYLVGMSFLTDDTTWKAKAQRLNAEYLLAKNINDTDSLASVLQSSLNLLKEDRSNLGQLLTVAESTFYSDKRHEENVAGKGKFNAAMSILIGVVIAVTVLIIHNKKKIRSLYRQVNRHKEMANNLRKLHADMERIAGEKEAVIQSQNRTIADLKAVPAPRPATLVCLSDCIEKLHAIDTFTDELLSGEKDRGKPDKSVLKRLVSFVEEAKNKKFISEVESAVNSHTGGLLDILHDQVPKTTSDDRRLFMFLLAGLSVKGISLITGAGIDSVYTRRRRLRAKISGSDCPRKHEMLEILK